MARLLYGVAYLARPARVLVVGGYYGNTLVWLAGPGFGPEPAYRGEHALSVDLDATAVAGARANFARLGADPRVEIEVLDGHRVDPAAGPFDLLLLDADDPVQRKGVYLTLLEALYPLVAAGGLVLAHDICVPAFATELAAYRRAVRAPGRFAGSISLEIDPCGLELSRTVAGPPAAAPATAGGTRVAEGGRR
jgi:predicted O-methyltransferase YrrM